MLLSNAHPPKNYQSLFSKLHCIQSTNSIVWYMAGVAKTRLTHATGAAEKGASKDNIQISNVYWTVHHCNS